MAGSGIDIIVAATDARASVIKGLRGFLGESSPRGGVILVDASRDGTADLAADAFPGLRIIRRAPGPLVPELWRIGLEATRGDLVAFTVATMVPGPGWLEALVRGLGDDAAAVGGAIVPSEGLRSTDRAAYLARYANYRRPGPRSLPAGDNSLYRRDRIDLDLVAKAGGFWEVEVLADLHRRGEVSRVVADAPVRFLGGTPFASLARQRARHGWRYGRSRSRAWGLPRRLAQAAALPAIPPLLAARACSRLRGEPGRGRWLGAIPAYAGLIACWAGGEAAGALAGPERMAPGQTRLSHASGLE